MNNLQTKPAKSTQKYLDIILSGSIEERTIISMRSLMNKNKDAANLINSAMDYPGLTLSADQNQKGYDFLMDQWKTSSGKERKNNPFGYREQNMLENFSHFTLAGFYDNSHYGQNPYWLALYRCYDKEGDCFEYYYDGKVNIIG